MPVAWHPKRWWDWCVSEDEKKEIMFIEEFQKCTLVVYNMGALGHVPLDIFWSESIKIF